MTNLITLTADERQRFAEYCRFTAHANRGLAEQMKMIPGGAMEALEQKYQREADALDTVAAMLDIIVDDEIG